MKTKAKTYVALILDQSGSMTSTKAQAVVGYNEQIQQMKMNSKDQDIFCSLVTFNGEVFEHLWCEKAESLAEASAEDYLTEGATAMRDAIGYTVEKLLKTTEPDENTAYLVVVISDGEENSSTKYSVDRLKALVETVQGTNRWTFTYMGCDEKVIKKVARETAIPVENMALWSNATAGLALRGQQMNARKLNQYYDSRTKGETKCANVYATCGLADFTQQDESLNQPVVPIAAVDMTVNNSSTTPFKNYVPVDWNSSSAGIAQ